MNIDTELVELVEAVSPPLIDLQQLDRLVKEDENPDAFDGECAVHDGCRPVFDRRLR
jgi:hypothetical protein